ncbi:WAT1-related protein At3g28050-like [Cucurbita maxima]|uniref:WAT1-related protein n=1 Tax=Cucurbita maxima TaxID=3661 RepID=A0A6J1JSK6_CUCMA|nr:WAT1-related protein At3g28050-like [Cucurbita maxima]
MKKMPFFSLIAYENLEAGIYREISITNTNPSFSLFFVRIRSDQNVADDGGCHALHCHDNGGEHRCDHINTNQSSHAKGMNNLVFLVYSNALATFLLLPFFLFSSRNNLGAPLSFSMILAFFLLGLNGSVGELLANTGINYSSPVLLSAMANLIPIFTFLLAVIFRMERLDLKRSSGKAKCLGTIIAVSGAFLITLYKGPVLIMSSSSQSVGQEAVALSQKPNWVFGGFLFLMVCFLSSTWKIAQVIHSPSLFRIVGRGVWEAQNKVTRAYVQSGQYHTIVKSHDF